MKKQVWVLAAMLIATLTACGVEGPPERPVGPVKQSGVTVSGTAEIGISGGTRP
ncbi:lipoprotein [Rhodovulum sp. P5]|uniref:lipoprotein n=1 Tax=Rhodovulum sp. P5 TaxID=1564506 RepID=UPI00352F8414